MVCFNRWIVDFRLVHGHPVWAEPHCCFIRQAKKSENEKQSCSDPTAAAAAAATRPLPLQSFRGLKQRLAAVASWFCRNSGAAHWFLFFFFVATQTGCVRFAFQVQCEDCRSRSARLNKLNPSL